MFDVNKLPGYFGRRHHQPAHHHHRQHIADGRHNMANKNLVSRTLKIVFLCDSGDVFFLCQRLTQIAIGMFDQLLCAGLKVRNVFKTLGILNGNVGCQNNGRGGGDILFC